MWKIEYKKIFLKELSALPGEYREKIEKLVFNEIAEQNPFSLGFIEKMQGYKDKYKVRVGNYRIGLTIEKDKMLITVNRVAHRKDIYKIFP
ncbi:MAG TPA: type II toxin-antitoxin system RelE/ParE family toxin [Ignavibacteria bacterium]|nr:type II toxin-antitoxin system RelE/ParE family toxin [Ignavibacteria bacterium]HMQ98095.1 type II toxin-antitoxin system RelE/ParE family toxin [Ignavibacteria bacterium]